ncbi:hypothetical protein JL722_10446 [Aureococcus anophagefferens]|nr:hypothetical protein JL722_10446 [Aureococcus anophagefferens]
MCRKRRPSLAAPAPTAVAAQRAVRASMRRASSAAVAPPPDVAAPAAEAAVEAAADDGINEGAAAEPRPSTLFKLELDAAAKRRADKRATPTPRARRRRPRPGRRVAVGGGPAAAGSSVDDCSSVRSSLGDEDSVVSSRGSPRGGGSRVAIDDDLNQRHSISAVVEADLRASLFPEHAATLDAIKGRSQREKRRSRRASVASSPRRRESAAASAIAGQLGAAAAEAAGRRADAAAAAAVKRRLAPETPPAVWDETVSFRAPALACASADCGNDAAALRGAYTKAGDAWFCADCWVEFSNAYPDEWTDSFGEETRAAESPPSSPDDAPAPAPRARTSIGRLFGGGALIEDDDDDEGRARAPSDGESPLLVERRASLLPVRTRAASDGASPQEAALSPEFVQRRSSLLRVATRGASVTPSRRGAPDAAAVFAEPAEPPPEFVARRASLRPVNPP